MTWDDWAGGRGAGGWTRLYGTGTSVDYDERPMRRPPTLIELPPAEPVEDTSIAVDEPTLDWPDAPEQPIVPFMREVLDFEPWPRQTQLLNSLYSDGIRTAIWRLGRRSGKDRMGAGVGVFEATANADAHLAHVPAGERVAVAIIAPSERQSRISHRFAATWLRSRLPHLIARDTDDEIELTNGVSLLTLPATSRSLRGYAVAVAILTEAAWFVDSEGSPLAAKEVWDSVAPAVAQFPQGKLLVLSTPRWATGWFADRCREAASAAYADTGHWWAPTSVMNPTISETFLEAERAKDPAMYAREYEARFVAGIGAVFPDNLVRLAVRRHEPIPISPGARYVVSLDASSGTGKDTFAAVTGSRDGENVTVRDVRGWRGSKAAPINHRSVLDEVAAIAKVHNDGTCLIDQWASEPIRQGLAERGVTVRPRAWTNESKEEAVMVLRQVLHQSRLSIPDHRGLISELAVLEQRLLPSGRTRYAAPPGAHDDYATALLALAHELTTKNAGRTDQSWIA